MTEATHDVGNGDESKVHKQQAVAKEVSEFGLRGSPPSDERPQSLKT